MDLAQRRTQPVFPTRSFQSVPLVAVAIAAVVLAIVVAVTLTVALTAAPTRPAAVVPGGVGTPAWLDYRAGERVMWAVEPALPGSSAWNSYRSDERAVDNAAASAAADH